jgi:hypothetical protein
LTGAALEYPEAIEDLYVASTIQEVEPCRPTLTGDIFTGVRIPGIDDEGLAVVLTHPCSMRIDGVSLVDRLLMAKVTEGQDVPLPEWVTGHFKIMPLPGLIGMPHAARFDDIGLVRTEDLERSERTACLTPFGTNLLQQRFIWYLTRFIVPTHQLNEACAAVFEEADLCEEWVMAASQRGQDVSDAQVEFHEWIRSRSESGTRRQESLADPQKRAGVRRDMRRLIAGA